MNDSYFLLYFQKYDSYRYVQLWTFAYVWLLSKPYKKEVALREQKIPLKCYQPLDLKYAFLEFF